MASKERPLTDLQKEALIMSEDTLFNDTKMIEGYGRSLRGLRLKGMVEGEVPHVYLTDAGKQELSRLVATVA